MDQRKKLDSTREEISDLTQQLETVDGRSLFLEKQMGAQYSFFKQQLDSIKDQLTVQECCPSSPVKVKDGSICTHYPLSTMPSSSVVVFTVFLVLRLCFLFDGMMHIPVCSVMPGFRLHPHTVTSSL
ncbi:hypothetical protein ADUPG1_014196 [Aduncisulcus paluster]|uniref:Uncharacterized protein n=1 Tax=Aduncisulcus paluster TaxID=2918883 RepID=A0ABQ5KB43_9EUKA|nr:hypothetical protein ADUPG1_014196 [Aduncisulcus paluster]